MTNDNIIETIAIEQEEAFLLERYFFEYNGLRSIIEQFTLESDFKLSEEKYMKLIDKYIEAFASYNLAWNHMRIKYLKKYKDEEAIVDFDIPAIIVKPMGEGGCMSCKR